jgi:hypothetical protein
MGKYNSPTGGGRYLEFTPQEGAKIVELYKKTLVLTVIAGLVRHDPETIKGWINRGRDDHLSHKDTDIAQFFREVKEARAQKINDIEQELLSRPKNWQALAWYLERTTRGEFGINADMDEQIANLHKQLKQIADHMAGKPSNVPRETNDQAQQ